MWTKFYDMHSGGTQKTDYSTIYIELPEIEAISFFENKFGIYPNSVTCSCCGNDFSVYEVNENEIVEGEDILIIRKEEVV